MLLMRLRDHGMPLPDPLLCNLFKTVEAEVPTERK